MLGLVAQALQAKGWQVVPQIGVSRFRIDLGIVIAGAAIAVALDGYIFTSSGQAPGLLFTIGLALGLVLRRPQLVRTGARMLVADPKVYVFDDSFSALDATTEANLNAAMREIVQDRTVIVVAQKVSSIKHADQILVMEAGRIVARGTHDELLQTSETYREIAASQAEVDA